MKISFSNYTSRSAIKTAVFILFILGLSNNEVAAQRFNSLVGASIGYKTGGFSAKIALDEKNYLQGTMGIVTPQPDFTAGAGISYHRHIPLNESRDFQFFYGVGGRAVIGDATALGVSGDLGLIYIYKKISLGLDISPTYFFNEELEFKPLFGINLRWVND